MVLALTQTGYVAFNSHIYPFSKYLLSGYDVLSTTPGGKNSTANTADGFPIFTKLPL